MSAPIWFVAALLASAASASDLPVITVTHDDTVIDRSCVVRIAPGTIIPDANANGVIHVTPGTNPDEPPIEIRFEDGSELWGARVGDPLADSSEASTVTPWDKLTGLGIRVDGVANVRIANARVHGYKVGIHATNAHMDPPPDTAFAHNDRVRGVGASFTENEAIRIVTWFEQGVSYSVEIECAAPMTDARCTGTEYARAIAESLTEARR